MKPTEDAHDLQRYHQKRDFDVTAEPEGAVKSSKRGNSFVIQKHAATALHYDFRLELDGVLVSWAVPKGPSLSTKDRRLAVHVEDHPLDYQSFEGSIPKGQYGGGAVIVWDRGTWDPVGDPRASLAKGRLDFSLDGEKLHGRFMLVRTKMDARGKENWLLFKRSDAEARTGKDADITKLRPESVLTGRTIEDLKKGVPLPEKKEKKTARAKKAKLPEFASIGPELATLVSDVPKGEGWVFEIKYDGYRTVAYKDGKSVRLATRNGQDWTDRYTAVAEALATVRATTAVFDGEIGYVDAAGRTSFQKLQAASPDDPRLVYHVFDLLHFDGADLRDRTLRERKEILKTLLAGEKHPLRLSDHVEGEGTGEKFFAEACKLGLEGIIAKRADAPYVSKRTKDWVKVKCQKRQEMVVVGFTPPHGQREGIGALLLGVNEDGKLRYAGKVGTGFSRKSLADLSKRLEKDVIDAPAVTGAPKIREASWVTPKLVAEVRFTEWTDGGALRHPSFEGLREDKKPSAVIREIEKAAPPAEKKKTAHASSVAGREDVAGVSISHPERVVDASSGITKVEIARYVAAIAPLLLPYAKKRPLMLLRCTESIDKKKSCFVQRHAVGQQGAIRAGHLGTGKAGNEAVVWVEEEAGLVELVQANAIELHGWGSRMPKWKCPDWIVLDLDPDEGLPFGKVVEAARDVKSELASLDLESFVKTTGGKGLHVVVPLSGRHDWDIVRTFSERFARALSTREPRRFVATMSKKARTGKIFIDWLRNGEAATAVLPYSPRAREGLTVAMPVAWKDLGSIDPKDFTVGNAAAYVARRKVDPWADLLSTKQSLQKRVLDAIAE